MPLNLNVLKPAAGRPLVEPRDIFASLGQRPWPRLRVEQDQVLKEWFARRHEKDLVIKQNTGGGKTVVGLLAAQSSLNEAMGPTAYLVPDTYLVKQVVAEASRLGLPVTTDPRDAQFQSSQAILVCTFQRVVNGRTLFGLTGDPYARLIGTLVIDDAHAALAAVRRQFTVEVPAGHPAFEAAVSVFGAELKRQSPKNGSALVEGDRCAALRIPFWSWADKHERVTAELERASGDNEQSGVFFSWPLVADHIKRAVVTISHRVLQLRTPCPPIDQIPAFHRAGRRIYLTATLSDDGVLVTELGADAVSVRRPITPERATDLGDRLILAPGALNPHLVTDALRTMVRQFADGDVDGDGIPGADPVNVVVLVPSNRAAQAWEQIANHVLHVGDMKPIVDRLSNGEHLGVVVLVNKYDGVDLPGDACRLLVIDGIPTPLDAGEQREAGALAGSVAMRIRKVQRLEQGMGRGIRDAEDHCAVLLLGDAAAMSLIDPADLAHFSPATRAQIELSGTVAGQIAGEGLGPVREVLALFLDRDERWKNLSSRATAGVAYDPEGHVSAVAEARRKAWDLATAGDPRGAARTLRESLGDLEEAERGWRLEEVAAYLHEASPEEAQSALKAAKQANSTVLMPAVPLQSKPVRGPQLQAVSACEFITARYDNGTSLQLGISHLLDDLDFDGDPERVEAAEAAMKDLGLHLGFAATRPEKEQSKGPDGCWGLTQHRNAVIELKTGVTRKDPSIIKSEADQLSGAVSWNAESGGPEDCIPVLVARDATVHPKAALPPKTRIITDATLKELKGHVRDFAQYLANEGRWRRPEEIRSALPRFHLDADHVIRDHSVKPARKSDS